MKNNSSSFSALALAGILGTVGFSSQALATDVEAAPAMNVTVTDLTPKFLNFYEEATREQASPDQRWALWKRDYNFAAVPPTPDGQAMARQLLDRAWPRYPSALGVIRAGAPGLTPDPIATANTIAGLLKPGKPINLNLYVYVGGFEENAFTAAQGGTIMVAVPVEASPEHRKLHMTHEMTHAIQIGMGSFSGGWIRTVGTTVLTEGLAMHVTSKLNPEVPVSAVVSNRPTWLAEADSKRIAILKDVQGALNSKSPQDVQRYTYGRGQAGIEREGYYAGWAVVGYMLEHGMSFADIARIPESEMPARAAEAIQQLLAEQTPAQ